MRRKEANANERNRIRQFNGAMARLRAATQHIIIEHRRKGRKVTKVREGRKVTKVREGRKVTKMRRKVTRVGGRDNRAVTELCFGHITTKTLMN